MIEISTKRSEGHENGKRDLARRPVTGRRSMPPKEHQQESIPASQSPYLCTLKLGNPTIIQVKSGTCLTEAPAILNRWTEYCSDLYIYEADKNPTVPDCPQIPYILYLSYEKGGSSS